MQARGVKELIKDSGIVPLTREERITPPTNKKRKNELKKLNQIITARLNLIPEFKNLNFKVYDPEFDRRDIFSAWGPSAKATIVTVPGTPERVITADGHSQTFYNYQGEAYDGSGEYQGDWDKFVQMINATNKADLTR